MGAHEAKGVDEVTRCSRCSRELKNIPEPYKGKMYGPVCLRKIKRKERDKMYPSLEEFW